MRKIEQMTSELIQILHSDTYQFEIDTEDFVFGFKDTIKKRTKSLAKALRLSYERTPDVLKKHREFKKLIINELDSINNVVINSPLDDNYVDSIINISLPKIKGEAIVNSLNERGIMVSTTSACSSKTFHLNEALYARGLSKENIEGSIRVSFSYKTKLEEIKTFVKVFKEEYNKKFKEVIESGI